MASGIGPPRGVRHAFAVPRPEILGTLEFAPRDQARSCAATESIPPPRRGPIIGLVIFTTHRGDRAEAILNAEGRWSCPGLPALDRVLNILFEPKRGAAGASAFGHDQLGRVASWLKGRVQGVVIEAVDYSGGMR